MYMYVNRKFMEQLSIINAPIKHIISSLDGLRVERGRVQAVRRVCCLHTGEAGTLSQAESLSGPSKLLGCVHPLPMVIISFPAERSSVIHCCCPVFQRKRTKFTEALCRRATVELVVWVPPAPGTSPTTLFPTLLAVLSFWSPVLPTISCPVCLTHAWWEGRCYVSLDVGV